MVQLATAYTRTIPESFERTLSLVRRQLSAVGLNVVHEIDFSGEPYFQVRVARRSCVVLLVDNPLLLFESLALDRAAAVFLPLHIVISGDRETSYVHWSNPTAGSGLRPPAPAKRPLEEIWLAVTLALSALPQAGEMAERGSPE
jgi:uncharacterized protein (DUF302 family)